MKAELALTEINWLEDKEVAVLLSAGLVRVIHLLDWLPRRYEDRRRFGAFPVQAGNVAVCLRGVVVDNRRKNFGGGRKSAQEVVVKAHEEHAFGGNTITLRWFNMPYIANMIAVGHELVFHGKTKEHGGRLVMDHPEFEIIKENGEASIHIDRIVPVYKNVSGLQQRRLREIIYRFIHEKYGEGISMEVNVDESYPRGEVYREVHFPLELEQSDAARRYFALEEFFKLQLQVAWRRRNYEQQRGRVLGGKTTLLKAFYESLPFDLTEAQKRSVKEMVTDMREPRPMHRLLQGDVGSGKTFVAMCGALLAVDSGAQVAIMAPTQILAEQHYLTFRKWLDTLGVGIALRTSNRREDNGANPARAQIVIGTHALLYENGDFDDLGLVIIDEQHKFGVEQRSKLVRQGIMPDVLVMTATPIPRSLTLTIYGDLDVSILDERPQGRGKIITGLRPKAKVTDVTKFIKQQLDVGRQAYLIYPLVEESDALKAQSATAEFEAWQARLKGYRVGLLHGKMNGEEKDGAMQAFRSGEIQVLVSTTVVEVGVDVPNANLMVIYNAERFGLSQLHQLRGRIGRGEHKSYCILVTDGKSADAMEKLRVLADTDDGFKIAEADLKLRGPGDVLGTQQSGLADLRFIDFLADTELVREARRLADALLQRDPELKTCPLLRQQIAAVGDTKMLG